MTQAQKNALLALGLVALGGLGFAVLQPGSAEAQAADGLPKVAAIATAAADKPRAVAIGYRPALTGRTGIDGKPLADAPAVWFAAAGSVGLCQGDVDGYTTGVDAQAALDALITKLDAKSAEEVASAKALVTEATKRAAAVDEAKK